MIPTTKYNKKINIKANENPFSFKIAFLLLVFIYISTSSQSSIQFNSPTKTHTNNMLDGKNFIQKLNYTINKNPINHSASSFAVVVTINYHYKVSHINP